MNSSTQSSENPNPVPPSEPPQPSNPPPQENSRNKLEQISRLMRGEENPKPVGDPPPDDGEPSPDDGEPKPQEQDGAARRPSVKVKSLDDAAKALGITVEELYALEVPLRNAKGEKLGKKLGELKDYFADQDSHQLSRLEWDEERGKQQAALNRDRAELQEIISAVPQERLSPAVVEAARKKLDSRIAVERRRTLEIIPSWEDDAARTADLTGIAEHLVDYGFPPSTLQGITDSRMLQYMRDNYLRMKRLNDALDRVKPVRTGTPRRASAGNGAPQKSVRPSTGARTQDVQVNAISKLLRG
jgi:hypothetical protein